MGSPLPLPYVCPWGCSRQCCPCELFARSGSRGTSRCLRCGRCRVVAPWAGLVEWRFTSATRRIARCSTARRTGTSSATNSSTVSIWTPGARAGSSVLSVCVETGCRVCPACASVGCGITRSAVSCVVNLGFSYVEAEVAYWSPGLGMRNCSRSSMTSDHRVGAKMDGRGRCSVCVCEGSVWSIQRPPGVALC
eukprot:15402871-Alexandrium_andersonii.AAC.1